MSLVCKMDLLTLWPWPLTFQPQTIALLVYPKVIPCTKFEHFGIILFWVMLRTNKQTNKQTAPNVLSTPTDSAREISIQSSVRGLVIYDGYGGICRRSGFWTYSKKAKELWWMMKVVTMKNCKLFCRSHRGSRDRKWICGSRSNDTISM